MKRGSRNLLCTMLSIIIVIGCVLFISASLVRTTICSQNYMLTFTQTQALKDYSFDTYNKRIALLAENCGVPVQIFEIAQEVDGYSETAAHRFFSGSDTTIFTNERINTYEVLITEYLEGNNISFDEKAVHNAAVEAAEIYSDCFGIKNIDPLRSFVNSSKAIYGRLSSFALVLILFPVLLIVWLFSEKKNALKYYIMSASATGISTIVISLLCLVIGVGKGLTINPSLYETAISNAFTFMFIIGIAAGILITSFAIALGTKLIKNQPDDD